MTMRGPELTIVLNAKDDVSKVLAHVNTQVQVLTNSANRAGQASAGLGSALGGVVDTLGKIGLAGLGVKVLSDVAGSLGGVAVSAVQAAGAMEQSEVAFTTLLGSAAAAASMLSNLQQFAATTPFQFPELVDASKRMLAFGFAAREIVPMLRTIGDAVSSLGGGAAEINRVTLALGQMSAKGKVSAQEMNQLAELGIPVWKMLADAIGVSIPAAMKLAEKGAISASVAIPALLEGMNKKFAGGMEAQSKTLLGMWSNLQDQMGFILTRIGKDIIEAFDLKDKLAGLTEFLGQMRKALEAGALKAVLEGIKSVAGDAANALRGLGTVANDTLQYIKANALAQEALAAALALVATRALLAAGAAGLGALFAVLGPVAAGVSSLSLALSVAALHGGYFFTVLLGSAGPMLALTAAIGGVILVLGALATNFMGVRDTLIKGLAILATGFLDFSTNVQTTIIVMVAQIKEQFAAIAEAGAELARVLPIWGEGIAAQLSGLAAGMRTSAGDWRRSAEDITASNETAKAGVIAFANETIKVTQGLQDTAGAAAEAINPMTAINKILAEGASTFNAGAAGAQMLDEALGGGGGGGGGGGLAGSAERAKTALEALGLSVGNVRKVGELLKWSLGQTDAAILSLGGDLLDTGEIIDDLGITVTRLTAMFVALGHSAAEAGDLASQVKASADARKAAAEAEKAAEEARKAREAAVSALSGRTELNIAANLLATASGASALAEAYNQATSAAEHLLAGNADVNVALGVIGATMDAAQAQLGKLTGAELARAGAIMDALRSLQGQLASGEIQVAEFVAGLRAYGSELATLLGSVEAAAKKAEDALGKTASSVLDRLKAGRTVTDALGDVAKADWVTSMEEGIRNAVIAGLKAGLSPAEIAAAVQPAVDAVDEALHPLAEKIRQEFAAAQEQIRKDSAETSRQMAEGWQQAMQADSVRSLLKAQRKAAEELVRSFREVSAARAEMESGAVRAQRKIAERNRLAGIAAAALAVNRGADIESAAAKEGVRATEVADFLGRSGQPVSQATKGRLGMLVEGGDSGDVVLQVDGRELARTSQNSLRDGLNRVRIGG